MGAPPFSNCLVEFLNISNSGFPFFVCEIGKIILIFLRVLLELNKRTCESSI